MKETVNIGERGIDVMVKIKYCLECIQEKVKEKTRKSTIARKCKKSSRDGEQLP